MTLLLDTCALLWLVADDPKLSVKARQHIAANSESLFVSAISAFEIGVKYHRGKLSLCDEPENWWSRAVAHHGLRVVDASDSIALASTALPAIHADPCDRIIIATAREIGATILTSDPLIAKYSEANVAW